VGLKHVPTEFRGPSVLHQETKSTPVTVLSAIANLSKGGLRYSSPKRAPRQEKKKESLGWKASRLWSALLPAKDKGDMGGPYSSDQGQKKEIEKVREGESYNKGVMPSRSRLLWRG